MNKNLLLALILLTGVGIIFGGCNNSDGDGDNPAAIQISGTVATGAPLDNAVVTAVNARGQASGPVDVNDDGSYSLSVIQGAPYILKAYCKSRDITLFSYASGDGTANITPLTNLALFVAAGLDTDLASLYDAWGKDAILSSDMMTATKRVNANLVDIYTENHVHPWTYNFFETPFNADGNGIDAVLDALDITIDPQGASIDAAVSIAVDDRTDILFDPYVDISDFFLIDRITPEAAYAKLSAGGEAILVCSYSDNACKNILIENALLKSEIEQQMASLSKDQEIIFY